ncbi:TPA: host specificity protein J [Acinetobacter baumannii]|nr:host specificity protein J [Acinetobacter baumannii]
MNTVVHGAKAGGAEARKPVVAIDSAQSKTYIKILYGLSEGPIKGLVNGIRSIYLDDTPLQDANGIWNFNNVTVDTRLGTNDQTYVEGFPDISSETGVGVELKAESPWVKGFTNTELDALRIRLRWGPLRQQNIENGDVSGITILYAIDLQTDGGTWTEVLNTQISDKTSANYERSHRIDLPKADFGWQVRVRRITPNASADSVSDKMYVQAITEVIDAKLRYPNTALLGLQYDAETFSNVAKMAAECEGVEILIPSNYNPENRQYTGLWDGTFKRAYTNNPAWHFYDACISKRYALGDWINSSMIDKWSLYRLGQYCDQLVPDGKGGLEPRFTLNVYEQSQDDAWSVLSKMAGAFRAYIYWDGRAIICDADIPQDTYYTYTAANVIDGHFEYSGTRARDRHTVAKVAWDNPNNRYKTEYLYVRDEAAIARLGIRIVDIAAYGCTSEGQAQRAGHWALKSEQFETRMVTFKVGLDGFIPRPGKVIEIADPLFAGRANGGRIAAVSADLKKITLDRDDVICRAGDRLVVNGENGKAQARIVQSMLGRVITVVSAFESVAVENVWVVDAQDLATMKFRVISITQDDKHQFTINALQYNAAKYDAIDNGAFIDERPISIINPKLQKPVESVSVSSDEMIQQGLTVATMLIAWPQIEGATKYQVEWRKDDGSWLKLPITGNNSVEVQGIYAGNYQARVIAINAFDIASLATYSILTTLKGKAGKPPKLAFISATGILFGMQLNWGFPAVGALDTAYTEIRVSPDGQSNIAVLGQFAYPTNAHTIQGLQPNLTQYYQARLIDRIGNIGDWSDWTHATTSADASDVLDILSGKISESELHEDLQTKIDRIDTVEGDIADIVQAVQNVEDGITQERTERQSGDQDVLNQLTIYKVSNDQAVAAVVEEVETLTTEQGALSSKIDGVFAQVNPPMIGSGNDLIGSEAGYAGVWSEQSARIEGDMAQAQRTDQVVAQIAQNDALYQQQFKATADAVSASVEVTENLQTVVGENKASIEEVTESVDGLYTQKFTKFDVNGKVMGWGGANDGVEGKFIFNVDALAIGSGDSVGYYPFIFRTTPYTDPETGTVFPVGAYLKTAFMDYASIKLAHIDTASIGSLSALNATLGTLVTYKDSAKPNGARMILEGGLIRIYDDNNVMRVRMGLWD